VQINEFVYKYANNMAPCVY